MIDVEFEFNYKTEDNTITFTVCNSRRGRDMMIIYDCNGIDITEYVFADNRKLYDKMVDELYHREETAEEERRYEGGHFDEDAWKGYD